MDNIQLRPGMTFGGWKLKRWLGAGGNGQVWLVTDVNGNEAAVKVLIKMKEIAYARFSSEVQIMRDNSDIPGILPVIDSMLPESIEGTGVCAWYAMPVAERLIDKAKELNMLRRAELFVPIAATLAELHHRKIAHRDLKPSNLIWYAGRSCVGDFGLVDYPGKADVTAAGQDIGPRWTMAPEVRRLGHTANPFPADVYSLAKTLWIVLSGEEKGFEGQYAASGSLRLGRIIEHSRHVDDRHAYWGGLDALLTDSTEHDGQRRPSIREFGERLTSWLSIAKSWSRSSAHNWISLQQKLFPVSVPRQATWQHLDDIIAVLNLLGATKSINHMFYPDGGGMDLDGAARAGEHERGCIELHLDDETSIIRPSRLVFESFGEDPEWNYFRLETKKLAPKTELAHPDDTWGKHEELIEIPGHGYLSNSHWRDEYQGSRLPPDSRTVLRYFGGPFVFFQKSSSYNLKLKTADFDVYDAEHAKMSASAFRKLIAALAQRFAQRKR